MSEQTVTVSMTVEALVGAGRYCQRAHVIFQNEKPNGEVQWLHNSSSGPWCLGDATDFLPDEYKGVVWTEEQWFDGIDERIYPATLTATFTRTADGWQRTGLAWPTRPMAEGHLKFSYEYYYGEGYYKFYGKSKNVHHNDNRWLVAESIVRPAPNFHGFTTHTTGVYMARVVDGKWVLTIEGVMQRAKEQEGGQE